MHPFLERCSKFIEENQLSIIRVAMARGEEEPEVLNCRQENFCQNTYSVSKTFTMTAVGLLWDKGLLHLNEKVCDILRNQVPAEGMDPRFEDVTVEMALTHRPGFPGGYLDIDVAPAGAFGWDYLAYLFRTPLVYDPGTEERYSDGAFYLLSRVVSAKIGQPMDTFLWKEIFYPLGYQEMAWSRCPQGFPMGATGLYIGAADIARLAQVYMHDGMYRGKRLLSGEWCQMAREKNYALHWDGARTHYAKGGMLGQVIAAFPAVDTAFSVQACSDDTGKVMEWIVKHHQELV